LTVCALAAASTLALSACGGGGKKQHAAAGTTASAGSTGATGTTGTAGTTGTSGAKGARANNGGSTVPKVKTTKPQRTTTPSSSGGTQTTAQAAPPKKKSKTNTPTPAVSPYQNPTKAELKVLYNQAKDVCKYLTLDGLASEYRVKPTPDAVATAYAKGYPKPSRPSVYRGCKAGVT
jgi:hypothetical protein